MRLSVILYSVTSLVSGLIRTVSQDVNGLGESQEITRIIMYLPNLLEVDMSKYKLYIHSISKLCI